jgi:hypothetical protein
MIPQAITDALASLETQAAAASPLQKASRATITALQLNAANLVTAVEAAQHSLAGELDTYAAKIDPVDIIQGVLSVFGSALDESNIAYLRGLTGRVASNLDQYGPRPPPSILQLPPGTPLPPVITSPWPVIAIPASGKLTLIVNRVMTPSSTALSIFANAPARTP